MSALYKIPLTLEPQPEGGYAVTCRDLPELITEGDTVEEALEHVADALRAVIEIYEDTGRSLPAGLLKDPEGSTIQFECLVRAA